MNANTSELIKAAIIGFLLPAVLLTVVVCAGRPTEATRESTAVTTTAPSQTAQPTALPPEPSVQPEPERAISVIIDGAPVEMTLERYVLGVVLSEVPASFAPEALKAQAVAARTAALYICETGRHQGSVCASAACCQNYIAPEDYLQIGGTQERLNKVSAAVEATAGQVLTYQGSLVCAAYFSCSGGCTEAAVAVWGADVPYLQAVESPGEEFAAVYTDQFYFTPEQLQAKLCASLSGSPESWFGEVTYTDGGGVATMEIGGVAYRGTTLRVLLGLRSTAFTVTVSEDVICFETRGYGHRVGMSQYGAQAMALSGADFAQILTHYYRGAEVSDYGH